MSLKLKVMGIEYIIFEAIKSIPQAGGNVVTEEMIFDVINEEDIQKMTNKRFSRLELSETICLMIENHLLEKLKIKHEGKEIIIILFTINGNSHLNYLRNTSKTLFPQNSKKIVYH